MSAQLQGIPASTGVVLGPAFVLSWPEFKVPHAVVSPQELESEVSRFEHACKRARERTAELKVEVENSLGAVQAKIFDPQLLMLEDPELVGVTRTYIRDSSLTAERAFYLRVLEVRSQWLDATHARVVDRLADLSDVETRVLAALHGESLPDIRADLPDHPIVLVSPELTPSRAAMLDPKRVLAIATDAGTRTSHSSILARSLGLPAVVGLGEISTTVSSGTLLIVDGYRGKVIVDPSEADVSSFHARDIKVKEIEKELGELASTEPVSRDGVRISLQANLEFPSDAEAALAAGADGVGLFRTEFLVVGVSAIPGEQEQYEAFRQVVDRFAPRPVVIRTYDLGGDKYPMFMPALTEENPFLGWRGIRVYDLMPELFRNQVRAVLRAARHGTVQMLLPMVNSVDEIQSVRRVMRSVREELDEEGIEHGECELGVMLETPASISIAEVIGRHVDFFSLGTNDLAQYVLAVDRGNARLARFYDGFHPALLRFIRDAVQGARRAGCPISVCGEAAADREGATLLMGLGLRVLSCPASAIPEMKRVVRSADIGRLEDAAEGLFDAETGEEVRARWDEAIREVAESPGIS